jgi:hypothetical protein
MFALSRDGKYICFLRYNVPLRIEIQCQSSLPKLVSLTNGRIHAIIIWNIKKVDFFTWKKYNVHNIKLQDEILLICKKKPKNIKFKFLA